MAVTDYFVDPSIAADTGAGTLGDPYGDLQHCLNTITQGSGGDRINIKAGTAEVLTAGISTTSYGAPSETQPLILQGYGAAQGDGSIGAINCNGNPFNANPLRDHVVLMDLHIYGGGKSLSARYVEFDNYCSLINCEVHDANTDGVYFGSGGIFLNNNVYDIESLNGIRGQTWSIALYNYVKPGEITNRDNCSINITTESVVYRNIQSRTGGSGYTHATTFMSSLHNTLITTDEDEQNTGVPYNLDLYHPYCAAWLIEGYRNTKAGGSTGMELQDEQSTSVLSYNAVYDTINAYTGSGNESIIVTDNEELVCSPFAKSGEETFANRYAWFAPLDIGNVWAGLPYGSAKGAVQTPGATYTASIEQVIVENNTFLDCDGSGTSGVGHEIFINGECTDGSGLMKSCIIANNVSTGYTQNRDDNQGEQWLITRVNWVMVSDNVIGEGTSAGVAAGDALAVYGSERLLVADNVIDGTWSDGIVGALILDALVTGNLLLGTYDSGGELNVDATRLNTEHNYGPSGTIVT